MREIATHVANPRGRSVSVRRASLLRRREPPGTGCVRHHAPVRPARKSARKVIPAKAVEECPDGKERRPSRIFSRSLSIEPEDLISWGVAVSGRM